LLSQSLRHLWRVDPPPGTLAGSLVHSADGVAKGGGIMLRGYISHEVQKWRLSDFPFATFQVSRKQVAIIELT
jgi:hypothetical protein